MLTESPDVNDCIMICDGQGALSFIAIFNACKCYDRCAETELVTPMPCAALAISCVCFKDCSNKLQKISDRWCVELLALNAIDS